MYEPSAILGLVVTAVLTAGLYALMSYGLALVYGVMKIINLAHAGTMMLSAFVVLELNRRFQLDPIAGAVVSACLFFLIGMAVYRLAVRRVVNAPPIASLLLLFGVWDDRVTLGYTTKLAGQVIAVGLCMIVGGIHIGPLTIGAVDFLPASVSTVITFVFQITKGRR